MVERRPVPDKIKPIDRRRIPFTGLQDKARSMGIHLVAGKGSGKSRMMGRLIAWQDFVKSVPLVILDPVGGTIDNFLDKLGYLSPAEQARLLPRVRYVNMGGHDGYVFPFPLYYRLTDGEDLYKTAFRYLETIRRLDPSLETASIQGWNAVQEIGTYAGMALAALGCQITEAEDLLTRPEVWLGRMAAVRDTYPDLESAIHFFNYRYLDMKPQEKERLTAAFRNKISMFMLERTTKAMFGASQPGIDWQEVVDRRLAVLLDFRDEHNIERRRFKMLWTFWYLMEFIKARGYGRHHPLSLIIDELTSMTNMRVMGKSLFADDIDELINVWARNSNIWLTIAHQEAWQVDERIRKSLMTMGTQIIGSTSDMESAKALGEQFFKIDPHAVKRYTPHWMTDMFRFFVIHEEPVNYTVEEQLYMSAYKMMAQPGFHFFIRPAPGEGNVVGPVYSVSIKNLDRNLWVHEADVRRARNLLMVKYGRPAAAILAELANRRREIRQLPAPTGPVAEGDDNLGTEPALSGMVDERPEDEAIFFSE